MVLFSKNKENNDNDSLGNITSSIFDGQGFGVSNNNTINLDIQENNENSIIKDSSENIENSSNQSNNYNLNSNIDNSQQKVDNSLDDKELIESQDDNLDPNVRYVVDDDTGLEEEKKLEQILNKITNSNLEIITDDYQNAINENTNKSYTDQNVKENNINNSVYNNLDNSINSDASFDLQELLDLKIQEYKKKYPECIESLIEILGEKRYNRLSDDIKYLLIRFLAEDAVSEFLEKYNICTNEEKLKIINNIITDYKRHIHYDKVNLDELDYYYITPFILFLNSERENN